LSIRRRSVVPDRFAPTIKIGASEWGMGVSILAREHSVQNVGQSLAQEIVIEELPGSVAVLTTFLDGSSITEKTSDALRESICKGWIIGPFKRDQHLVGKNVSCLPYACG
jgi:hypothetical protein